MQKDNLSAVLRKITPEDKPELERLIGLTINIERHAPRYVDERIAKMSKEELMQYCLGNGDHYSSRPDYIPAIDESIWADIMQVRGYNISGSDHILELVVDEKTEVLKRWYGDKVIFMAYLNNKHRGDFNFTLSSGGVIVPDSSLLKGAEYYWGPNPGYKIILAGEGQGTKIPNNE